MAKDKLTEYDATAANNTVVGDVNLAENSCLPSDLNNAVREVMSHLKGFASGTDAIDALTVTGAATVNGAFTSPGIDDNADATVITIDSSENVLVGTTSTTGFQTSSSATGTIAYTGGTIATNVSGDGALYLNRLTSDGDIALFRKDGTTVGSIGVINSDRLYIGTPDGSQCAIRFDGDTQDILPSNASGSALDNAISLGDSGTRFKDLYLSGGAYIGGTGSANHLDDYEEGTWTPAVTTSTSVTSSGGGLGATYTKVGRMVNVQAYITWTNNQNNDGSTFYISGLPFTEGNYHYGAFTIGFFGGANMNDAVGVVDLNNTRLYMHQNDGSTSSILNSDIHTRGLTTIIVSGTYYV